MARLHALYASDGRIAAAMGAFRCSTRIGNGYIFFERLSLRRRTAHETLLANLDGAAPGRTAIAALLARQARLFLAQQLGRDRLASGFLEPPNRPASI